jgi:hypothetical protein
MPCVRMDATVADMHMDVFQHPYAYAPCHRVLTRPAVLALAA